MMISPAKWLYLRNRVDSRVRERAAKVQMNRAV
jgi:hypothetical protein